MNLLLTCCTTPDFTRNHFALWNNFCIAEWMPGDELVPYLLFSPTSEFACIDAIVFLEPNEGVGYREWPDGRLTPFPEMMPWEAHYGNAVIAQRIRCLPETCAMRDGRKWKRIPQIVLTKHGRRYEAYDGLDIEFVIDVTEMMLFSGYASPVTWDKIEKIVNQYHREATADYERVGFVVTVDHGLYRVKRAYHKRSERESEFYYGGKDKRRFHGFVTIGRDDCIRDPLNLRAVEKALGYVPQFSERAVLIGRTPQTDDKGLWDKRKAEQPSVRIITYDEVLQEQRDRRARRRPRVSFFQ